MAERITIDGIDLGIAGTWFEIPDLSPLWDLADEDFEGVHLPGVDGDRAFPAELIGTTYSLTFEMTGTINRSGALIDGLVAQRTQLWDHRQYVADNIAGRSSASNGLRTLVLYLPDGSATDSMSVRVGRRLFLAGTAPSDVEGTLELWIPSGEV